MNMPVAPTLPALPAPSRLRRLLDFGAVRLCLAFVVTALAGALTARVLHAHTEGLLHALAPGFGGAAAALTVYLAYVRLVEGRSAGELARQRALPELGIGLTGGAALVALVVAGLAAAGGYQFQGLNEHPGKLGAAFAEMVFAGVFEELLLRGIVLRILERSLGSGAALLLSSLLFGLMHLPGDGFSPLAMATTVVAGLFLGAAFLATRRLWLCIALHTGWNFTLGSVFSVAVSGHGQPKGLLLGQLSGPDWLTGGSYGLEGSVLTLTVLLFAGAGLLRIAVVRRHLRARGQQQGASKIAQR